MNLESVQLSVVTVV